MNTGKGRAIVTGDENFGRIRYTPEEALELARAEFAEAAKQHNRDRFAVAPNDTRASSSNGGVTIQKVEIVVNSNQDAGRVARSVMAELEKLHRPRTPPREPGGSSAPPALPLRSHVGTLKAWLRGAP